MIIVLIRAILLVLNIRPLPHISPLLVPPLLMVLAAPSSPLTSPPICKQFECSTVMTEVPCQLHNADFTSGGGFSIFFPRPSYQNVAVNKYFNTSVPLPPAQYWNRSNRGFPDIGAIGQNCLVVGDGNIYGIGGTSASSPTIASILTLINNHLMNSGKKALGFANPLLYDMYANCPSCFHGADMYDNKCTELACCEYGYVAAKGWDPVTGIGSPSYSNMIAYIDSTL